MSSILTNNGAMVALQTLKSVNNNLLETQSMISTGKAVGSAKDNSAIWAISKVMESDVKGFKAISDSLALGESTVAVARQAAETVTDLMTEMKGKIVAAQEDNVDRDKIQADISALQDQINSVVNAAQFNGLNLVDGSQTTVDVLSSLNRDSTGTVTASNITVNAQNLSTADYAAAAVFAGSDNESANGDTAGFNADSGGGAGLIIIDSGGFGGNFAAGDKVSIAIGDQTASYTLTADDIASATPDDMVAVGLKNAIDALGIADLVVEYDSGSPGELNFTNNDAVNDMFITASFSNAGAGGLSAMSGIDVSTALGAANALSAIEDLINTSVDAAASFGSVEGRIEIQSDFIGKLTDSLKSGIGSMVDANMEEASARLQALQVQQQLGVQSLSIANQAPQSILSLFG